MELDYEDLGKRFDCACGDVIEKLSTVYATDYKGAGPEKLSAFLELIQKEFDAAETTFIRDNKIGSDARALQDIKAIAKSYARKCLSDYSKVA
ncbi:hypothetical protein OGH69_17975 [Flavobacterium sp. MFBS3-15]|uniref:hypothetical protein n=1 Tax=Flavobacterium sp. MFBS3-15 TaxID=2989816 RepID=UPI0022369183|nr:hypothetical protein [Flavobacterium sp. MFBS3-15]MCW4470861.1 hypothetical protein [Flavobacterium sp. MFBS3-15]